MASWATTLAGELGPYGITVNNILPGSTDTARLQSLFQKKAEAQDKDVRTIREETAESIPLRRIATPEELAYAVAFLASPLAAYITGISLPVDGGRTQAL